MNYLELRGAPVCLSSGLLTATGAETVYDTTVTIDYVIDGIIRSKTAVTDGATPTSDIVSAATFASTPLLPNKGCVVVWGLNSSGTVQCAMGRHTALDVSGNFIVAPEFPPIPASNFVPFAYQVLKAGSTAAAAGVVFGTSNWNATGFTNVIKNVMFLPSRPQVS